MNNQQAEAMIEEDDEDELAPSASKKFRNRLNSNEGDEVLKEVFSLSSSGILANCYFIFNLLHFSG